MNPKFFWKLAPVLGLKGITHESSLLFGLNKLKFLSKSILYDIVSIYKSLKFADTIIILGVSGCIFLPLVKFFGKSQLIVNIDGLEWKRQKWRGFAKQFLKFSERLAVKFSSVVVADNEAIAKHVQSNYNAVCKTIAYGGDHACVDHKEKLMVDIPFKVEGYAFALCRIEPENNVHLILEAFASASMNLIFVGNWQASDYGCELIDRYSSIANMKLLDPIYDLDVLAMYRRNCRVYIHGHSAGGTNPSLVEMMHFEKPIIAFDCVYNRATMEDKGQYFSSSSSLSKSIKTPECFEEGKELGDIARRRYTWSVVRAQYHKLFDFK